MVIDHSLQAVEDLLLSINSTVPLLSETTEHILSAGGKRLRPQLLLLAHAAVGGGKIIDVIPLAAAVEIIHTATLVHDDINDHGSLRRGHETVNARWGSTFALLTGDFMFTKTYEIMTPYSSQLNMILAKAATELVEGETLQIHAAKQGTLDQDTYFEIISKKTAALFVACVELGATAAEAPPAWIEALCQYAFNLGIAFQITDDILDLVADPQQLGKNVGIDQAQGHGIAAVKPGNNEAGTALRAATLDIAPQTASGPFKASILDGVSFDDAIRTGHEKAQEFANRAVASLKTLPSSPAVDELRALAQQVIDRHY